MSERTVCGKSLPAVGNETAPYGDELCSGCWRPIAWPNSRFVLGHFMARSATDYEWEPARGPVEFTVSVLNVATGIWTTVRGQIALKLEPGRTVSGRHSMSVITELADKVRITQTCVTPLDPETDLRPHFRGLGMRSTTRLITGLAHLHRADQLDGLAIVNELLEWERKIDGKKRERRREDRDLQLRRVAALYNVHSIQGERAKAIAGDPEVMRLGGRSEPYSVGYARQLISATRDAGYLEEAVPRGRAGGRRKRRR